MAKILCVLYPDPVGGYPPTYARDDIPVLRGYPDGQTLPTPRRSTSRRANCSDASRASWGLRRFLEAAGHTLVVTSDKDGPDSIFDKELPDADVVISQPFWPAYLTAERIAEATNLKLAITAGIGSDHVDLNAAIDRDITVAEVTFCNSISVAEHAVMQILALVRNFLPSHDWITEGGGTSPTAWSGPTTSKAWTSGSSPPAGSDSPCCAAWPPSTCACITANDIVYRPRSSTSSA